MLSTEQRHDDRTTDFTANYGKSDTWNVNPTNTLTQSNKSANGTINMESIVGTWSNTRIVFLTQKPKTTSISYRYCADTVGTRLLRTKHAVESENYGYMCVWILNSLNSDARYALELSIECRWANEAARIARHKAESAMWKRESNGWRCRLIFRLAHRVWLRYGYVSEAWRRQTAFQLVILLKLAAQSWCQ